MEFLVKKLSTGDVMVFDKKTRELFLIPPQHAAEWEKGTEKTAQFAQELAKRGQGMHLTKHNLDVLQSALAHIIHLE